MAPVTVEVEGGALLVDGSEVVLQVAVHHGLLHNAVMTTIDHNAVMTGWQPCPSSTDEPTYAAG